MNKRELAILEKAFVREIDAALTRTVPILQTKSKLAEKLVADGLLERVEVTCGRPPMQVKASGYVLTHAGRYEYCATCVDGED